MLRKGWLLLLESIKIQYLDKFKEYKEFMSSVSYLPFSLLLTHHLLLTSIKSKPEKISQGGRLNFHKLIKICVLARDCVTRQLYT